MSTLRILIADDHEMVRSGLRSLLEGVAGWQVVGEARTGREAVQAAASLSPDVIIIDLTMPELNGLEATRQICRALPEAEILVLTMHESDQIVRDVLEAGARGYVLKSDAGEYLVAAVRSLAKHQPFFTAKVSTVLLREYLSRGKNSRRRGEGSGLLTDREREILQLLAEGRTNKEVAASLNLSVKTVENHRASIMQKLNLHSVTDLVRYAIRNKFIEL